MNWNFQASPVRGGVRTLSSFHNESPDAAPDGAVHLSLAAFTHGCRHGLYDVARYAGSTITSSHANLSERRLLVGAENAAQDVAHFADRGIGAH
jgi:hypothetical protein